MSSTTTTTTTTTITTNNAPSKKRKRSTVLIGPSTLYYNKLDIFNNGKPVSFLLLGEKHHEMNKIKCKEIEGVNHEITVAQFLKELTNPQRYAEFEFPTTFDFYVEGPLNKKGEYEEGCSLHNIMRCFTDLPSNVRKHRVDIRKIVVEKAWFTAGKDNDVDRNWQVVDNTGLSLSKEEVESEHEKIYRIIESFFLGFLPDEMYIMEPQTREVRVKKFQTSQEELRALFNTPTSNESQNIAQSIFIENVLSEETLPKIMTKFSEAYNMSRFKNNTADPNPLMLEDFLLSRLDYIRNVDPRINTLARKNDFVSLAREYIFQGWGFLMDLYTLICIFKKEDPIKQRALQEDYEKRKPWLMERNANIKQELEEVLDDIGDTVDVTFVIYYAGAQHIKNLKNMLFLIFNEDEEKRKQYKTHKIEYKAMDDNNCLLIHENDKEKIFNMDDIKEYHNHFNIQMIQVIKNIFKLKF